MAGETFSPILSQVLVAEVQDGLMENMRNQLVYGNRAYAEMGRFTKGHDTIKFAAVPDMATATTPLTEGTAPTAVALSVETVTVDALQYGQVVHISDLARLKSPFDLAATARERLSRSAAETTDELVRDEIVLGGTAFYSESGATARTDLDTTDDKLSAAVLRKLAARMFYGNVKPFDGRNFLLIVSPGQEYDLKADTATGGFIATNQYSNPGPILNNEIGTIAGFRIIVAQNAPTFSSTTTVHAAIALGSLPGWGWGDMQTLKAYHTPPGGQTDPLHQNEKLGWKMDFGVASIDNARYFRMESTATDVTGQS